MPIQPQRDVLPLDGLRLKHEKCTVITLENDFQFSIRPNVQWKLTRMRRYSPFWQLIVSRENAGPLTSFAGCSLEDAVVDAYRSEDLRLSARTNRELIDLHSAFRMLQFEGQAYISKKASFASALDEQLNSEMLAKLFDGSTLSNGLKISICPVNVFDLGYGQAAVVTRYHGKSLQEADRKNSAEWARLGAEISNMFLASHVAWAGNAPRNMCLNEEQGVCYIFDAENAAFDERPDKLDTDPLLQMAYLMNWSPHISQEDYYSILASPVICNGPLDPYENALKRLTGLTDNNAVRQLAVTSMIDACRCGKEDYSQVLLPVEIFHIFKDFLNHEGRYLAVNLVSRLRNYEQLRYRFDATVTNILCTGLRRAGYGEAMRGDWYHLRETVHTIIGCLAVSADRSEFCPNEIIQRLCTTALPFAAGQSAAQSIEMRKPENLMPVLRRVLQCEGSVRPLAKVLESRL